MGSVCIFTVHTSLERFAYYNPQVGNVLEEVGVNLLVF
jgi:hypothetical protein